MFRPDHGSHLNLGPNTSTQSLVQPKLYTQRVVLCTHFWLQTKGSSGFRRVLRGSRSESTAGFCGVVKRWPRGRQIASYCTRVSQVHHCTSRSHNPFFSPQHDDLMTGSWAPLVWQLRRSEFSCSPVVPFLLFGFKVPWPTQKMAALLFIWLLGYQVLFALRVRFVSAVRLFCRRRNCQAFATAFAPFLLALLQIKAS